MRNMQKEIELDSKIRRKFPLDKRQKIKQFNLLDYIRLDKHPFKKINEYLKMKKQKRRIFMILMQLRNGKYNLFNVVTSSQTFKYEGGLYYLDGDMVRENVFSKLNMLFYHQDCALPFKVDFNISDLREELLKNNSDVEKAINPLSLKAFINAQVIEKVLRGAELSKDLQMIKLIVIINTITIIALGLLIARMGGMI
jgi:hypothetical protein